MTLSGPHNLRSLEGLLTNNPDNADTFFRVSPGKEEGWILVTLDHKICAMVNLEDPSPFLVKSW